MSMTTGRETMPESASGQEIAWSIGALFGLAFTLMMAAWAWARFAVVRERVGRGGVVRWGPRWNLVLGLLVAMIFFGLGWLGYLALGIVAMLTPPPIAEVSREAADRFAWLLIAMEIAHALGQAVLFVGFLSLSGRRLFPPSRYLRFARRA